MNAVELDDVRVVRAGRLVLSALSLHVGEHERVAVCGPNGAGKSTLLDVMLGLCPIDAGRVRVHGHAPPAPEVGFVPQDPGASLLPWLSLADNIMLPLRLLGAERATRQAALQAVRERLDPRQTLPLARRPGELSVGQRQLAALLRAMIAGPRLLLCDEPFSALDAEAREHLRHVLTHTTGGTDGPALVFVTHDAIDVAELAERRIMLAPVPQILTSIAS